MSNYPALDSAIATFEGFGKPGTIATNQNNPGDLQFGPFATAHGSTGPGATATGASAPTAIFPTVAQGQAAQDALVSQYADQGFDLGSLINAWSGTTPAPGATTPYQDYVASKLGVPLTTPVSSLKDPLAGITAGTQGYTAPTVFSGILNTLTGSKGVPNTPAAPVTASTIWGLPIGRIAAGIAGLIFIAGGIFLLKPTQNIITTARGLV